MGKIEIELEELFRKPMYLDMLMNQLNNGELYQLIGVSFIHILRNNLHGKDIEFNKPEKIRQALHGIWKKVEKDLLMSYNECGK